MMLNVSPRFLWVTLPALSLKFKPALVKLVPKSFNWSTFTPSVPLMPGATLVKVLPPASMPLMVTLGPPTMVKPSWLMVVGPITMLPVLPKSRFLFNSKSMTLPLRLTLMLLSLLAVPMSTVAPGCTWLAVSPLVWTFQPKEAMFCTA